MSEEKRELTAEVNHFELDKYKRIKKIKMENFVSPDVKIYFTLDRSSQIVIRAISKEQEEFLKNGSSNN